MGIEDAFLHDILAHPDDDAPRLIYADWLDEHNDPRGEFIRIQCALAQLSDEDPRRWPLELREREILREQEAKWLPEKFGKTPCIFHRGFVEEIALSPETFPDGADFLFERAPIRRLHLHLGGWGRAELHNTFLTQVASSCHLERIRSLSLIDLTLSQSDLHAFLATPTLRQLTELRLTNLGVVSDEHQRPGPHALPVEMVFALTEMPFHSELTTLQLEGMALSPDALRVIANAASLKSLRKLKLSGNRLTPQALTVLAEGGLLPRLETLQLDSNLLGDAGALAVREWPALPGLTRLSLGQNQIFAAGVKALGEAPALRELISLNLSRNISCDDGAAALASSAWTRLQSLDLWFNGVGDRGVQMLAHCQTLPQLTRLNLTANCVTDVGARALIESSGLPRLARVDLLRNDIGTVEQKCLRDRFGAFVSC